MKNKKRRKFVDVEITNARELTLRVYCPDVKKWEKKRVLSDFFSLKDNFRFIQEVWGKQAQIIEFKESDISFISNLPCNGDNVLRLPVNGYEIGSMEAYRLLPDKSKSSKFRFATIVPEGVHPEGQIRENAHIFFRVASKDVRFTSKVYRNESYDAIFYMNEEHELDRDIKRYDGFVNQKNLKKPLKIKFEHKSNF